MTTHSTMLNTWAPVLQFEILKGAPKNIDELLLGRTLSFTLHDRLTKFDSIEWRLDNSDGLMTQVQYIALGVILRVRLGYAGDPGIWRGFVVNKMRGGVGVFDNPGGLANGVASGGKGSMRGGRLDETAITYQGRNRMASNPRRNTTTTKPGKYLASPSLTRLDYLTRGVDPKKGERTYAGTTTSQIVAQIAKDMGFFPEQQLIEDTSKYAEETIESGSITLPTGEPEAVWLDRQASRLGFTFAMKSGTLHFHSPHWPGASKKLVHHAFQIGGPDIIEGPAIDGDFVLPLPSEFKTVGTDPLTRRSAVQGIVAGSTTHTADLLTVGWLGKLPKAQRDRLVRNYITPISKAGETATGKAQAGFINRQLAAYKIMVTLVGNPAVWAGQNIRLSGSNTPLVDGIWLADEVKHIFDGTTYKTQMMLRVPRKRHKGSIKTSRGTVQGNNNDTISTTEYSYVGQLNPGRVTPATRQSGSSAKDEYTGHLGGPLGGQKLGKSYANPFRPSGNVDRRFKTSTHAGTH